MMQDKVLNVQPWGAVVVVRSSLPKDADVQPTTMGLTWTDPQDQFSINVWLNPVLFQKGKTKKDQSLLDNELLGFLVHEVQHILQFIEKAVETKLDDETAAYLAQWLFVQIKKTIRH